MTKLKTALVTGASSGMGKVIAQQLAKDGYTVIAAARRVDAMEDLKPLGIHPVAMDVADDAGLTAAFEAIVAEHGAIDILVNNAGFGLYGAVEDVPMEDARYQFDVNVFGLARLTQLVTPAMREAGRGKIINISSMGGRIYTPLGAWYHATKHAVEGFSDCLRFELEPFGIDVVVVQPGAIDTGFADVLSGPLAKYSAEGAYAEMVQKFAAATAQSYEGNNMSPPQVIADVVSRAVAADRPKTRYVAGKLARPLMFMRKYLGDRMFDRVLRRSIQ